MQQTKNKLDYVQDAEVGILVAFKFRGKVRSGKIVDKKLGALIIETQNGTPYTVLNEDIVWVKTGDRWPRQVFALLKGKTPQED
jgi:hypothetical protein